VTSAIEQDVQTVIVVLAMGAFLGAAYVDVRRRRIPNALSYMIGSLGLLRILLADDPMTAGWTLAAAAGVLLVAFMFFWGGTFGGGDAKLLTGAVLLIGYRDLFDFIVLMSLFGAVLALSLLIGDRLIPRFRRARQRAAAPDATAVAARRDVWPTVPYGVAISAAGMIILVLQVSVSR
jgi:Flp pilus assembly protein protease CpaA